MINSIRIKLPTLKCPPILQCLNLLQFTSFLQLIVQKSIIGNTLIMYIGFIIEQLIDCKTTCLVINVLYWPDTIEYQQIPIPCER